MKSVNSRSAVSLLRPPAGSFVVAVGRDGGAFDAHVSSLTCDPGGPQTFQGVARRPIRAGRMFLSTTYAAPPSPFNEMHSTSFPCGRQRSPPRLADLTKPWPRSPRGFRRDRAAGHSGCCCRCCAAAEPLAPQRPPVAGRRRRRPRSIQPGPWPGCRVPPSTPCTRRAASTMPRPTVNPLDRSSMCSGIPSVGLRKVSVKPRRSR